MKKEKEIKKENFFDKLLKYINNRTLRKPRRNKPAVVKYNNKGIPVNMNYFGGFGRNYAVVYFPKRKKIKGWQKNNIYCN